MVSREPIAVGVGALIVALLATGVVAAATRGHHHAARVANVVHSASPSTTPPAASVTALRDETDHLTVSVPATWQSPTLAQGSYADLVQAFAAKNPQFGSIVSQRVGKSAATVGLFAVDPGSHTTLVIESAEALPDAVSAATATGVLPGPLVDQYEKLGIQVVGTETLHLPLGPVLHAALALVVGGQELAADQYLFVEGPKIITLTIEGPGGNADLVLHDRVARTLNRAP